MEESKKKVVMIGVVLACLALVVGVTFVSRSGTPKGSKAMKGQKEWILCSNPDCKNLYQVDSSYYYEFINKNRVGPGIPPMPCPKCGEDSGYRVLKCEKCEAVYPEGSCGGDAFSDKCPECGYSKEKTAREAAKARRQGK